MKIKKPGLLLLAMIPAAALAHDTWLVPVSFRNQPGQAVQLRFATSEAFPLSDSPVGPQRIERFTLRTAAGTKPVTGYQLQGAYLVATVTPQTPGHVVLVAETKPRAFTLEPKVFNEYLEHEELKQILAARAAAGKTDSPGRERYRKIAKAVVCVGDAKDSVYAKGDGLWLEIIPEKSPCGLRVGDSLTVRVLFEGKPLASAHLAAGYEGVTGHKYPVWTSTDKQGRASIKLDRPGAWFARVLHMVAAQNDAEADWHSAFSTLTFEVGTSVSAGAEAAIRQVLDAQAAAWNRGDVEAFMEGYWKSDATTFSSTSGVARGWQALLERYKRSYPDRKAMGRLTFSDLEITTLGPDAAFVLGRWQLERESDRPGGVYTLVLRRFPEGWRIVHDHTSAVAMR